MPFTADELHHLPNVLSAPRFTRYLVEKNGDKVAALELYKWNLDLSSSLLAPLHVCEVSIRNAITEAIELTYGALWPWAQSFEISLPNPPRHFNPRKEIKILRVKHPTVGKIIADMKFAFWQNMFTGRHDGPIWNAHIRTVLPHTDPALSVQMIRGEAFAAMDTIRELRNRIAHHEPIFGRDIQKEFDLIKTVIGWRNQAARGWVENIQRVTATLDAKP
jgi:hypothetical protein